MECSASTSVTLKESGLHVESVGMSIDSWLTQRGILITVGKWRTFRELIGVQIQRVYLGISN